MGSPRYRKHAGGVYNLHYHFVWCPTYRKPVLIGPVADALGQLLEESAPALDVQIEAVEIMPDHVHLFVSTPPTEAPQHLANQFKGYTSWVLRQRFAHVCTRLPSLWSRSSSVGSAGLETPETTKREIAAQKTRGTE